MFFTGNGPPSAHTHTYTLLRVSSSSSTTVELKSRKHTKVSAVTVRIRAVTRRRNEAGSSGDRVHTQGYAFILKVKLYSAHLLTDGQSFVLGYVICVIFREN